LLYNSYDYSVKKIILKKQAYESAPDRIGYKINYESELNPSQFDAVMHAKGPALVIAGAGTGKTRTLIYRLSRLVEEGTAPESIILLTFTRKSAAEMMRRSSLMLDVRCERVAGGTFHSFSLNILRRWADNIGYNNNFTILDSGDCEDTINILRSNLIQNKSKRRFPKKETLAKIFNLSVNKKQSIDTIVTNQFAYFADEIEQINQIFAMYVNYKKRYNLMDYDDMLTNLLFLLREKENIRKELHSKFNYVLVDEYQDTNRLQHEIILNLANTEKNVMAVGDDAQSIYSFRGAEFKNIMIFPGDFPDCKIYTIEENYRSTQPILNFTNRIIASAAYKYEKELFSHKESTEKPAVVTAANERQQSLLIVQIGRAHV